MDPGPTVTSVGLIGVGALGSYVTTSLQFRRQQKAESVRWLKERRFEVYTTALATLRSSGDLAVEATEMDKQRRNWNGRVSRQDAPLGLSTVLNHLQLVGSQDVRLAADKIDRWHGGTLSNGYAFSDY